VANPPPPVPTIGGIHRYERRNPRPSCPLWHRPACPTHAKKPRDLELKAGQKPERAQKDDV
jgi:hypothetical protein